jgi:hypothetical protein
MGRLRTCTLGIIAAIAGLAGCAQDDARYLHPLPPLSGEARAELGPVALDVAAPAAPAVPNVPLVPEITLGEAAGGAALASLPVLTLPVGCLGEPLCTMAAGAVSVATYILAVPVLTTIALAGGPPDRADVMRTTDSITRVIQATEWDAILRRDVEAAMKKARHPVASAANASPRLQLTLEGPFLVTDQFIAMPTATIHGELAKDGSCLIDRRWRWNGDGDDFVDFGDHDGAAFRKAMEDGLKQLSTAIAEDLFAATKPRETAYLSKSAFDSGAGPRLVAVPMSYEDRIGSWDKTETIAEPRCAGVM